MFPHERYSIADDTLHLYRCLDDVDDEVRDRAALYLKVLNEQALAEVYVREGSSP
jgi:hypothetical protein